MSEWFIAIALVNGFAFYAFYLGTRWGRYTGTTPERSESEQTPPESWKRSQRHPSRTASEFDLS